MATKSTTKKKPESAKNPEILQRSTTQQGYEPGQRYRKVEFIEADADEGATPVWARIRTSLTADELERFAEFNGAIEASVLYDLVAPNVVAWNVVFRDETGVAYDVAPPSVGGAASFKYIPYSLFWAIFTALRQTPYRRVDPKSPASSATTEDS